MTKRKIIITLLVFGAIFAALSIVFIFWGNSLNDNISDDEKDYFLRSQSNIQFEIEQATTFNILSNVDILKEINPNSASISKLNGDLLNMMRFSLTNLHEVLKGSSPDIDLVRKWANMNYEQLSDEKIILVQSGNIQDLLDEINNEKEKRRTIFLFAIIFEIMGLLLIQIALIFQIPGPLSQNI